MLSQFKAHLNEMLDKKPGHLYVEDKFMAIRMPDGQILVMPGDFKNISEEDANAHLQKVLLKLQ